MENKNVKVRVALYLVIATILFFSVNVIGSLALTKYDLDLTQDSMFSLSQGSENILKDLKEPITLRFFFSNKAASGIPLAKSYATRVRSIIERFESESGGKITLKVIDPEPFSDEEDMAASYGLKGLDIDQMGTKVYLGMAATNSVDQTKVIPFFAPDREKFLEYDLANVIYSLANPQKKKVGIISSIKMAADSFMGIPGMGGASWLIAEQMGQIYEVQDLTDKVTEIPDGIDVLMVVQPRDSSLETMYAIDQYLLKGGSVLLFADPYSEVAGGADKEAKSFSGILNLMLSRWGVQIEPYKVIADRMAARRKPASGPDDPNRFSAVDYPVWLGLTQNNLSTDDVSTNLLKSINMNTAGYIEIKGAEGVEIKSLIKSGKQAMKVPVENIDLADPNKLLREFVSDNKEYDLAVRISGKFSSIFPDQADEKAGKLAASEKVGNIILVADSDMLRDEAWAQTQELQGYKMVMPIADNYGFVNNALDNLSGTSDLISLRGRGTSNRAFTKVNDLRRQAEEGYLAKEQELKTRLADAESKLSDLQKMAESQAGNELQYKVEQQMEIKRFTDDAVKVKKELRQVQGELRKGIEGLGKVVKIINIWLMPLLVMAFAVFLLLTRNAKMRKKYRG